jgi:hypothetical protein
MLYTSIVRGCYEWSLGLINALPLMGHFLNCAKSFQDQTGSVE